MEENKYRNSGILFNNDDNWTIIQKGKLNFDGNDHQIIGVKRNNKNGQPIVELYVAIATLKQNLDKQGEKSPDAKGVASNVRFDGAKTISAWKVKSDKGNERVDLKMRDFNTDYNNQKNEQDNTENKIENQNVNTADLDDEIPF